MALLSVCKGSSVVVENVFEKRLSHVSALIDMGADITVKGKRAYINGVNRLKGANVVANDLRGGAALVLAGLNAEGQTIVDNIFHVERGYFEFDKKLNAIGADIVKIDR